MPSHFSFDIFDTVVTRRLSRPVDVFTLLGERLGEEGIRVPPFGLFRLLRIRCERWSRRFDPDYEVKLPDIHRMLGRFLFWSEKDQLRAAELEREIESSVLRCTPHGRRAVAAARDEGHRVAFVSDMYLEEEFVRVILLREGLLREGDVLAISGEWKASKARGTIWKRLIETLGTPTAGIFHQGDNPHSDVQSPMTAGIPSARLGTAEISRWEEPDKGDRAKQLMEFGGIAAMSRLARARCEEPDDYWTCLGAGILGPMLAGFTAWMLQEARGQGIGTLWFLSRDGWLLLESARLMACEDSPELEYFCAGRRQLQQALGRPVPREALFAGSRSQTLRLLGSRLSLPWSALEELAADLGLGSAPLDHHLDHNQKHLLSEHLETPAWCLRLEQHAMQAAMPVRGYVSAMQARASGRVAVVDVGWQGRSQDQLSDLLPDLAPLRGYYLGYSGRASEAASKAGWIYDFSKSEGSPTLSTHQRVFEVLIGGVSGPLKGYQQVDGAWVAVFEEAEAGESAPGRERAQQAALEFVRLAVDPAYADWWTEESLRRFSSRNLDRLFVRPTPEDAERFRSWTASTDEAHQDSVPLVQGFDLRRIRSCLKKEQPWAFLWPEAALKNSTPAGRVAMQAAWTASRLRG